MTDRMRVPEFVLAVVECVARRHGATVGEILGGCRLAHAVTARWEVIRELRRRHPRASTVTIGRWMGMHHTSILDALKETIQ